MLNDDSQMQWLFMTGFSVRLAASAGRCEVVVAAAEPSRLRPIKGLSPPSALFSTLIGCHSASQKSRGRCDWARLGSKRHDVSSRLRKKGSSSGEAGSTAFQDDGPTQSASQSQ